MVTIDFNGWRKLRNKSLTHKRLLQLRYRPITYKLYSCTARTMVESSTEL